MKKWASHPFLFTIFTKQIKRHICSPAIAGIQIRKDQLCAYKFLYYILKQKRDISGDNSGLRNG